MDTQPGQDRKRVENLDGEKKCQRLKLSIESQNNQLGHTYNGTHLTLFHTAPVVQAEWMKDKKVFQSVWANALINGII